MSRTTGPRRPVSDAPQARTPHIDRFSPEVQEEILRSYSDSQQERADRAAATPATEEA